MSHPSGRFFRSNRSYILLVILLALVLYVLIPQFGSFRRSWHLLSHPNPGWAAAALGLTSLTYLAGAMTYYLLAFKRLEYARTVVVQLAAMFINRLLPAGVGALGTNYVYLHRNKHSAYQATTVVAVNNLLGVLGHTLIIIIALVYAPAQARVLPGDPHTVIKDIVVGLAAGVLIMGVLALAFGRRHLKRTAQELIGQVSQYRYRLTRLTAALVSSMTLTLCNVLCLGSCALALGIHEPFVVVLFIFSFAAGTGTASPTPGGLGGFEAGLTAGFVAYHVDGSTALAAALLYRLVSYWLPLLAGAPALLAAQKRRLLSA